MLLLDGQTRSHAEMSVPNWLNDAPAFPNGDNGAYNVAGDPSTTFLQTPTSASFDPSQLQYQQMQHRMQNGITRNASPASQSPMYPTQNVVPSKRPRPRDDSIGASPQQYSGGLPTARSQTPQGAYPGYQGSMNGGPQFPASNPYPQFPQANNNANQSPLMPNQAFNPQVLNPGPPMMSPSPFSPATQNFGAQTTPPHSDHGSRVNTPQGGTQTYSQGLPYSANQAGLPPANAMVNGSSNPQLHNPQASNPQRMYEASKMRQMQQAHANGIGVPPRQPGPMMNPGAQPMNAMQNYQMAQIRQQAQAQAQAQAAQAQQRPNGMDQMMRQMMQFMQTRGVPFNPQPVIASKPINCVHIFMCGMKAGGSRNIQSQNRWPQVAQMLSFPEPQLMAAAQDIQAYWNNHLLQWEHHWQMQSMQSHQQQQQQQRQRAMAGNVRAMTNPQNVDPAMRQGSFSPAKKIQDLQGQRLMQPPAPVQNQSHIPTRTENAPSPQSQMLQNNRQSAYRRPASDVPQDRGQISSGQQVSADTEQGIVLKSPHKIDNYYVPKVHTLDPSINPKSDPGDVQGNRTTTSAIDENSEEAQLAQPDRRPDHHGGLPVSDLSFQDSLHTLLKYKRTMPQLAELGVIDIRALTLSIKSGIHGEVRLALDVIVALSYASPLPLNECDELLDAIIDCANDQIELLAEGSHKTSDAVQLLSYQEQVRDFNTQSYVLQEVSDVGSLSYELERAANRLICITTILRNLSFFSFQASHETLREPHVLRMITTTIRYLGTRKLFLQTHQNALDFGKDVVVFLSSLAPFINLTGKDEALSILHFLLSFAPEPRPIAQDNEISFATYVPASDRYYPLAIDSLAKLLARDPNRSLCRNIFASDSASSPPFHLLTRAFGLAVAAIPDIVNNKDHGIMAVARNATLVQGLLSAEVLINMIPASEHGLACSWLRSQDGFSLKLMAILSATAKMPNLEPQRYRDGRMRVDEDLYIGLRMINNRGIVVLRKLAEKAQDAEASAKDLSSHVSSPQKQSIGANRKPDGLRQLYALVGLAN